MDNQSINNTIFFAMLYILGSSVLIYPQCTWQNLQYCWDSSSQSFNNQVTSSTRCRRNIQWGSMIAIPSKRRRVLIAFEIWENNKRTLIWVEVHGSFSVTLNDPAEAPSIAAYKTLSRLTGISYAWHVK